jgi:hypothetical protein
MIKFDSLIITPIRSNTIRDISSYVGKVDYLIKGDIRYSTTARAGGDKIDESGFFGVYDSLYQYTTSILYPEGGPIHFRLGSILFTPTTVTIRLPYGSRQIELNSGPELRKTLSAFNKVSFSTIDGTLEELVAQWVEYIDTQARSELQSAPR